MNDIEISFKKVVEIFKARKNNAYRKVNEEMILLYFEVGEYIANIKTTHLMVKKL